MHRWGLGEVSPPPHYYLFWLWLVRPLDRPTTHNMLGNGEVDDPSPACKQNLSRGLGGAERMSGPMISRASLPAPTPIAYERVIHALCRAVAFERSPNYPGSIRERSELSARLVEADERFLGFGGKFVKVGRRSSDRVGCR